MYTFPPAGHTKAGESEVSSMSNENNNRKNAQNQAQNQKKGESAQNKKREQAQNQSERQQQFYRRKGGREGFPVPLYGPPQTENLAI